MKNNRVAASAFASIVLAGLLASAGARAEKTDSLKPLNIKYGKVHVDNVTQTTVFTGDVIATRGTLVLKADRADVKESPDGYMSVVLTTDPGKMATFRQKRDGGPDLWAEGQARRIEYDERAELVKFIQSAEIRQLEGRKVTQQMNQEFISYDSRKEVLLGLNDASGGDKQSGGRGTMVFQPRRAPAGVPAGAPAQASPAAGKQ